MNNNNDNIFDVQLNERLTNEELPFDPMAWEMMEEKLDEKPERRPFWKSGKIYLLGVIALLLLSTFIYWPYHYNNTLDNSISEVQPLNVETEVDSDASKETLSKETLIIERNADQSAHQSALSSITNNSSEIVTLNTEDKAIKRSTETKKAFVEASNSSSNAERRKNDPHDFTIQKHNTSRATTSSKSNRLTKANDPSSVSENENGFGGSMIDLNQSKISDKRNLSNIPNLSATTKGISVSESSLTTIDQLQPIPTKMSLVDYERLFKTDPSMVEIKERISRPRHQINLAIGGGMTELNIEDAYVGGVTPVATASQETFVSLSYLYRIHPNWGLEIGAAASYQRQQMAYYLQAGEFDLFEPRFAQVNVKAFEGKYEIFANAHFFLPLSQRSELDFYAGYYAINPFATGGWGGGSSVPVEPKAIGSNNPELINANWSGGTGPFEYGRLKLGLNYNFLTNKRNNIGVGISYMHELFRDVEGQYQMFATQDMVQVAGNFKTNGSGLKVQVNYGFGLDTPPWEKYKTKEASGLKNPWYFGMRYGTKKLFYKDVLSRNLLSANAHNYTYIFLGHYINQKMALEFGLNFSEYVYSTPSEFEIDPRSFGVRRQAMLTVPFAMRYDLYQTDRLTVYGKGVLSADFRSNRSSDFIPSSAAKTSDKTKFLPNAGIEYGVDFRLFGGLNLGLSGRYNHAFRTTSEHKYPVKLSEDESSFNTITLRNKYLAWGVELKYMFNHKSFNKAH